MKVAKCHEQLSNDRNGKSRTEIHQQAVPTNNLLTLCSLLSHLSHSLSCSWWRTTNDNQTLVMISIYIFLWHNRFTVASTSKCGSERMLRTICNCCIKFWFISGMIVKHKLISFLKLDTKSLTLNKRHNSSSKVNSSSPMLFFFRCWYFLLRKCLYPMFKNLKPNKCKLSMWWHFFFYYIRTSDKCRIFSMYPLLSSANMKSSTTVEEVLIIFWIILSSFNCLQWGIQKTTSFSKIWEKSATVGDCFLTFYIQNPSNRARS